MKILLINNNPVVSRLTALSARKEDIEIDEIQEVTELSSDTYDIVFVDADSWTKDVRDVISENIKTQKSVLFYADGDEEDKASFDLSILKPFLPSEVSAVIRSIEVNTDIIEENTNEISHFDIIEDAKESKRDELFDLDGLVEVEAKKEDINFDDKLEEAFPLRINTLDDDLFEDDSKIDLELKEESSPKEAEPKDNELFDLDLSDEISSLEDDLFSEDKKEESSKIVERLELDDNILETVNDIEEEPLLSLDETALELDEPKRETQILDASEIENIKGILTEDISNDMTLEDLMPSIPTVSPKIEAEKEDEVISKSDIDSSTLVETLTSMPVQGLRELLAGAKVNIKIKFPKSKK